jgi:hypothetical protein
VKETFQLNGDPVVCVTGSPTAARDDDATGSRAKRLPGVAASTIGGEMCVRILTPMQLTSLAMPVGITACGGPPWTLQESPSTITLRWYSDETDSSVADWVVQTHCASTSKNAELISYDRAQIGRYRCR